MYTYTPYYIDIHFFMYASQFLFRYKSGTSKLTKYHHHHPTPLRPSLFVTFSVCAFSINTVELIVRSNCFCFLLILFLYASDSMEIWLWIVWFIFMICYIYLAKPSIFCITFHTLSRLTYPHLLKFLRIFFVVSFSFAVFSYCRSGFPFLPQSIVCFFTSKFCWWAIWLSLLSSTLHFTALDSTNEHLVLKPNLTAITLSKLNKIQKKPTTKQTFSLKFKATKKIILTKKDIK